MSKSPALVGMALVAALAVAVSASMTSSPQAPASFQEIGDLIVGEWTGEGVWAADYPGFGTKGDSFTSTHTCRWAVGNQAIVCEGVAGGPTWTSLHFWDPVAEQVRVVAVNSGGNYDQGTVVKQGDRLVTETSGAFADGQLVQYKWESIFENDGNTMVQMGATILDGVPTEFRDIYQRVRR
jgi:hypothetical protein